MADTTVRRTINRARRVGQQKLQPLPLVTRRFAAWTLEVSLIAISGLVPFSLGMYAKTQAVGEQVTLNPVLAVTEEAVVRTLAQPARERDRQVPVLANFFWSAALAAPLSLTIWQLYLMAKTGSTLPKRWFGIRVVTAKGTVPGMRRVLLREGVGSWGLPLAIAYVIWHSSSAFPSMGMFLGLSGLMVLGEGMSARFSRQRRCLHDRLAGTFVVDANRSCAPFVTRANAERKQTASRESAYLWQGQPPTAIASSSHYLNSSFVVPTAVATRRRSWWKWMRQHPSVALLLVSLCCMAAVLGTLVGTQVYIQTQKNQRQLQDSKSEQFIALLKQLNADSPTSLDERQKAILALGTLDDPQALQLLTDLLGQETATGPIDVTQQALASSGPKALPHLRTLNQSLAHELESRRYTNKPEESELLAQKLQATQTVIANILRIYSGKLQSVELNRTHLGPVLNHTTTFSLTLDQTDLSGIQLKATNLNQASFRQSRWRGPGEDGRWDTFDDWIADLSDAQLREANLSGANLSRVALDRANLIRSNLSQANLAGASLDNANLSSTQLVGANLRDAILVNTSLTGADLGEAVLERANLHAARLGRVSALGTQLRSANLTQSDWQGADLSKADLSGANLRSADFSTTKLAGANLRDAQLQNANLRNADLRQADLRGVNLTDADMQGAALFASKLGQPNPFIADLPEESLSAIVEGVDFAKAKNLDAKQLAYICTQGGLHPRCP